ncbi:LacI family DNA-binding transcriptional regulator [Frondihabitans australicus]|uniref:LacI family transcriptional regulator n=1 Tax=Frondihabitans australicus TaxID=386892 RepID=A0A495IJI7_9MICO|nr:LacI family DNA-binding transcriptional regulator [Frondihabitans australicus]RKR75296.1 LacI family transcriptional regulator [Frondihabitans australicus]
MAVSMGDVAAHAGVSQRTVSNVVNRSANVAPATRARVEASLAALGYRPNAAARKLRSGRTGAITLALPGFDERYFADLAEAVIRHARDLGVDVLVETTGGDHERELAILRGRQGLLTDGVIMSAVTIGSADESVQRAPYPLVLVGDHEFEGPVDHVGIPNRKAARAAVEHLFATGRRRVALVGENDESLDSASLRKQGYFAALEHRGVPASEAIVVAAPWQYEAGEAVVAALLARDEMPDGIFAMNDSLALGVISALLRAGVRVPQDCAVVGFDDTLEARHGFPTLTSVAPSLDEIAANALDMLRAQFIDAGAERASVERRHVAFELRVRESSAPAE